MLIKGKVFISHAHEDNARCRPLLAALTAWGVPYWFDTEQATGGNELALKIQRAIEESQYFIRVCTLSSVSSFWVRKETGAFVSLQAEDFRRGIEDRVLIPVILDPGYPLQLEDRGVVQIRAAGAPEASWLDNLRRALVVPMPINGPRGPASSSSRGQPNFFLLLDLDPDALWGDRLFQTRLKEMQNRWVWETMYSPRPDIVRAATRNLSLVPEIRRVMSDLEARAQEIEGAHVELSALSARRLDDLNRELAVIQAKGYVERSEIDDLVRRYQTTVSEQDVRERITVPIRGEFRPEPLERYPADSIKRPLDFLGEKSLYTLLAHTVDPSIGINTDSATLLLASERLLYRWTPEEMAQSAEVRAKASLAGRAALVFRNEETRARYDETLRRQPLNELLKTYERACAASAAISSEQVRMFLGEARRLGFDDEFAYEQLRALAERRHWSIAPRS
ncbi:MAG TPA: toll/interleukin-1 receptor domain-containing protein [Ktedonobacterales bacterium]